MPEDKKPWEQNLDAENNPAEPKPWEMGLESETGVKKKELSVSPLPSNSSPSVSPSTDGALDYSGKFNFLTGKNEPIVDSPEGQVAQKTLDIQENAPDLLRAATTPASTTAKDQINYDPKLQEKLYGSQAQEALTRGIVHLGNSILKTPAFLYDLAASEINKLNPDYTTTRGRVGEILPTAKEIGENVPTDLNLTGALDKVEEDSRKRYSKEYDKRISDYLFGEKPDYDKGFEALGLGVLENAPTTLALMFGNASGLGAVEGTLLGGAVFGADKMSQLDKSAPEGMSQEEKLSNAALTGLAEGVGEQIGLTSLGNVVKNVLAKSGADAAEKIAKDGFVKTYGKLMARYIGIGANEVSSEMATQFAQNAVDKYSGANPDINLLDGVADAGLLALGSSVSMAGPVAIMDVAKTSAGIKKAASINEQQQALNEDLDNPEIPNSTKNIISSKIKDLNEEAADLATQEREKYQGLTPEGQDQVDGLIAISKQMADAANDESVSEQTRDIIAKDVKQVEDAIEQAYETYKKPSEEEMVAQQEQERAANNEEIDFFKTLQQEVGLDEDQLARLAELEAINTTSPVSEETVAENKSPVGETPEATVTDQGSVQETPIETTQTQNINEKTQEANPAIEAEVLTEPVSQPQKQKLSQELIDEEEPDVVDAPEALKKLDDEITVMKAADKKVMDTKFVGMLERAYKMRSEGKISRQAYTEFKNKVKDVYKGKKNIDAEELKLKSTELIGKVKERLLGQGYKNMVLASGAPITPKTVADLLDLTNSIIHKIIDAGAGAVSLAEATKKAIGIVKKHPTYKKLVTSKELDENEFESALGAEQQQSDSEEDATMQTKDDISTTQQRPEVEQGDEISGEKRKKKTVVRLKESENFKEIVKNIDQDEAFYRSINIAKAKKHIGALLSEFESKNMLEGLAREMVSGNSPFNEKIDGLAAFMLADRLRAIAGKDGNEMQKSMINKLAADLLVSKNKRTNIAATQTALEGEIAKLLPISEEGLKDYAQAAMSQVQDTYLTDAQKKDVESAVKDINDLIASEEGQRAIREAVDTELDKIASATKGKEWVNNLNTAMGSLKIDLKDC